jgi:proteic killer suppression protein
MRIQQLEAAVDIHDLWKTPALNFEKLRGFENRYSLRLDRKWRLELEIEWEDKGKTKGTVYIVELSRHYEG